jgi:hypothetical protein
VKAAPPGLSGRATLGRGQKVLEWNVEKRPTRLGEHVPDLGVAELGVYMDAPAVASCEPRSDRELAADRHGPPVPDEDSRRDRREAVPGGEQAAGLVQRSGDEPAVDDARTCLVARAEREGGLVALDSLLGRPREVEALRVFAAAPTGRVVVGRDPAQRSPPRSKCAR